ncbi:MAG: DUF4238 domain-containing protein [Flavobacterium sp.]|nr:DUF4238 domain-containing protein [Flavobacterium sp.]MBP7318959.1 DUF4238 domain-containing protein [Flavobacterium sp.]
MKDNTNQHYVPQYYLKNFSVNNNLHIYDLKTKKFFKNSIRNTAYKKFFYNVEVNFFNNILENEKFENEDFIDKIINQNNECILATFFDSFNPTRERIINKDERTTISVIDFHSLVDFILVQIYRNPKLSLFFKYVDDLVKNNKSRKKTKEFDKIVRGIVILLLFNELHHSRETIFKHDIIEKFQPIINEIRLMKDLITNSYKMVFWNKTSVDFITSDCAMSLMRLEENDLFTTVFVPINTKIAVLLVNKNSKLFDNNIEKNSTIIHLEEKDIFQVKTYNLSIAEKANRFVYSMNGDFPERISHIEFKPWWNL